MRPPVLVLSHHAGYACRRCGECCTAGWRIEADSVRRSAIANAFGHVFERGTSVLRLNPGGACVLFRPRTAEGSCACSVQVDGGHGALPAACRHFPRVYLHDASATRVTLSHFCPTAASLLFDSGPLQIVDAPASLVRPGDLEGLDASCALPPLLRPGMLMDVGAYAAWEREAVHVLAASSRSAESAVSILAQSAEALRAWRPGSQSLTAAVHDAFAACPPVTSDAAAAGCCDWFALARSCVPAGLSHPDLPDGFADVDARFVHTRWLDLSGPLRRYLAGRVFGSWVAYQGQGLRTIVSSLRCALAVVRVEAARACGTARRALDEQTFAQAVRQADLLLVHRADSQTLATRLSTCEARPRL